MKPVGLTIDTCEPSGPRMRSPIPYRHSSRPIRPRQKRTRKGAFLVNRGRAIPTRHPLRHYPNGLD